MFWLVFHINSQVMLAKIAHVTIALHKETRMMGRLLEFAHQHKMTHSEQWILSFITRSPEEQRGIHPVASHTIKLTIPSHHGDSDQKTNEAGKINISDGVKRLSSCLSALQQWFCLNDMALNPDKTEAIIFGTRQRHCLFQSYICRCLRSPSAHHQSNQDPRCHSGQSPYNG